KARAVCGDHFPRTQLYRLTVGQIKMERPFQAKPLAEGQSVAGRGRMKFADASRAGNSGGDRSSFDRQTAGAFRHLKKNRAIGKVHLPRAFVETENRVRAEAGDG